MEGQLRRTGLTALMDYLHYYWQPDDDGKYLKSVSWEKLYQSYKFNTELISLIKIAGDQIETAFREQIAYQMEQTYGCYWHYQEEMFWEPRETILKDGKKKVRCAYYDLQKFMGKYFIEECLHPFRSILHKISFGQLFRTYVELNPCPEKEQIADAFGIPHVATFESNMFAIEKLRNFCAHPRLLWAKKYKDIRYRLYYPDYPMWLKNPAVKSNTIYYRLCLLNYFLQAIESDYPFVVKLYKLLEENSEVVSPTEMGFTKGWENEKMWKLE